MISYQPAAVNGKSLGYNFKLLKLSLLMKANLNTLLITKPSDYKIFILLALILAVSLCSNSFIRTLLVR